MPRVLRILNRFNLGGPTYNAAYLTKYMAPDFETLLVGGLNDPSEANSEYIAQNIGLNPIIIPEMRREINPRADYYALKKIKQIIQDFKPDIVHTHASKAGALGRRAAYSMNVPVIVHTFHGHVFDAYFGSIKASIYKNIERRLAKKSSKIIAISEIQKDDLVRKYKICPDEKVQVIPLGFDLCSFTDKQEEKRKDFRAKFKVADDEIAIGIIGRLVPVKNHQLFLQGIDYILKNSTKKIRAFIVGDGSCNTLIKQKAKELVIDYVDIEQPMVIAPLTLTSWIKNIDWVMAGVDIVALTSLNEGTPVSIIEAKAANKPVVATNVGGIENIVQHNQTALLSDIADEQLFIKNLFDLVEHVELRNKIASGGELVRANYHYTRLVNDMKELYCNLLQIPS